MTGFDSGRPSDPGSGGTEAEEAAWEVATAESLRAQGNLSEAATWYRRAAQHLMEAGDDERAIEVAKLAAELAALDDAGRSSARRGDSHLNELREVNRAETAQDKPARPVAQPAAPAVVQPVAQPAGHPVVHAAAQPAAKRPAVAAGEADVPPWEAEAGTAAAQPPPVPPGATTGTPGRRRSRRPPPDGGAASMPRLPRPRSGAAPSKRTSASPSGPRPAAPAEGHADAPPSTLAAMLDEAVSSLDAVPQEPIVSDSAASRSRLPMSYMPHRIAEADRLIAKLPALPLFSDVPEDRLREVARQAGVIRYAAGEALCEVGAPEGPLFAIIEGSASVALPGDGGDVAVLTAGDFVGEIGALYGGPRTATVIAREPVEAVALAPSLVRALAREFPAFLEQLVESARERMVRSLPFVCSALRKLETADRITVFRAFELRSFPEGAVLLSEGDVAESLFIVAAGELELYGGGIVATRTHHARVGDIVGVTSVSSGEPAGVSARASHALLAACMPRAQFGTIAAQVPAFVELLRHVGAPGSGVLC